MPEYDMRKWYWDMEWQQGGEHHDKITTIVCMIIMIKNTINGLWLPNYIQMKDDEFIFDNEKDMIESLCEL